MSLDVHVALLVAIFTVIRCDHIPSRVDVARGYVEEYAHHDFPLWALDHPDACPTLLDVLEHVGKGREDLLDPWDMPYELEVVGPSRVVVRSYGPDGIRGTDDDITSR